MENPWGNHAITIFSEANMEGDSFAKPKEDPNNT